MELTWFEEICLSFTENSFLLHYRIEDAFFDLKQYITKLNLPEHISVFFNQANAGETNPAFVDNEQGSVSCLTQGGAEPTSEPSKDTNKLNEAGTNENTTESLEVVPSSSENSDFLRNFGATVFDVELANTTSDVTGKTAQIEPVTNHLNYTSTQLVLTADSLHVVNQKKGTEGRNYFLWRYVDHFDVYGPVIIPMIIWIFIVAYMVRQSMPTSTLFNRKHIKKESERPESAKISTTVSRINKLVNLLKRGLRLVFKN
jgi:hypothetical protein